MRALPARRIASTGLCVTLLLGIGASAALSADGDAARERGHAASQAPVPNADALLAQVKSLGDLGGTLQPVTDLLKAVLKADNGQLPLDEATKLVDGVKAATTLASGTAPVVPPVAPPVALPTTPAVPVTPAVPTTPALPTATASTLPMPLNDGKAVKGPFDIKADALAELQKSVDTLLTAVTSGDAANVVPAVRGVVTSLVGLVAATLLGSGLPAPDLAGLPPLPKLPAGVPQLPVPAPPLRLPVR